MKTTPGKYFILRYRHYKKKYSGMRPGAIEIKTHPAGAPETNQYFFLALDKMFSSSYCTCCILLVSGRRISLIIRYSSIRQFNLSLGVNDLPYTET